MKKLPLIISFFSVVFCYSQKVHEKNKIDSGSYLLDLGSYKKGIYILKINSNGQTTSRKIILY
jgi:hypothetical protein